MDGPSEKITKDQSVPDECFYMSQKPVVKESPRTTQTQVVFDALSYRHELTFLSDHWETGPKLKSAMVKTLFNFRLRKIGPTTDI